MTAAPSRRAGAARIDGRLRGSMAGDGGSTVGGAAGWRRSTGGTDQPRGAWINGEWRRLGSSAPAGHGSSASPHHSRGRPAVGASRATPSPELAAVGSPHRRSADRSQGLLYDSTTHGRRHGSSLCGVHHVGPSRRGEARACGAQQVREGEGTGRRGHGLAGDDTTKLVVVD
ncbi:unnamed protein product [Urochloa humidicola]